MVNIERRDVSISIARLVAMLMIILCHMFSYYKSELALWFNVGVQVFFVISGFLYGTKDIESPISFIKRNYRKILIPYWCFLLLSIAAYLIICPNELSISSIVKAFFCSGTIKGLGHLWFVGYILFCYFLTPYLYSLRKYMQGQSIIKTMLTYGVLLVVIQLIGFLFNSYFEPDKVSCYVIGFVLADLFVRLKPSQSLALKWVIVLTALVMNCVEVYVKYYAQIEFVGWQNVVFRAFCRYSHMFLGLAIFLLFYGKFKNVEYLRVLRFSDKYSYPVYLVHQLFILSPLTLMSITDTRFLNWMIVFFAIILGGVILHHLSSLLDKTLCDRPRMIVRNL